jgi:hypothetical protein
VFQGLDVKMYGSVLSMVLMWMGVIGKVLVLHVIVRTRLGVC